MVIIGTLFYSCKHLTVLELDFVLQNWIETDSNLKIIIH